MKRHTWKPYAAWIAGTEAVGALSGWLTRDGTKLYTQTIVQPPLSPPSIVFPIVWMILFALMGVGAARIYLSRSSKERSTGLLLYGLQLAFNFVWSFLIFQFRLFGFALLWLAILWLLILGMALTFRKVDSLAAGLQIPYLLWVAFAGYLNFGVWMLN